MIDTDPKKIDAVLNHGTADVIVKKDLREKMLSGKKLRVKLGIDPSGADLHIGHTVVVKKLKEFQDLGHQVVLLFGNFTGQIGDPTGKMDSRPPKTQDELEKNAERYIEQVKKILDVSNLEVVWNADWLSKLNFADVIKLASCFTVSQMMERDMFQKRVEKNLPISMHEFMYPLMQGYDSVPIKADVELGGTDQTFNLLAGRTIQKAYDMEPQNIVTVPILEGTDGKKKMGKSDGNFIAIEDKASDMYGKVMSIPDTLIAKYFTLATNVGPDKVKEVEKLLKEGSVNPRDLKMELARELVTFYHDEVLANEAQEEFINVFKKGGLPEDIPTFKADSSNIIDVLVDSGLVASRGEAKRVIKGGGVKVDSEVVSDMNAEFDFSSKKIVQVGKKKYIEVSS